MTLTMTCADRTTDLILGEEDHLRIVARRLARCESDSDDLVQETLLRAYHARDRFEPGTSVRAWTTTILRRLHIAGSVRARRRGLQTDTDAGGPLGTISGPPLSPRDDPAPDLRSLGDRLEDPVKRALDRIPEVYRTSFFLSVVRELSCEEIGQQMRVPVGTVMSRVHRAREQLKGDLLPHRSSLAAHADRRIGGSPRAAAARRAGRAGVVV